MILVTMPGGGRPCEGPDPDENVGVYYAALSGFFNEDDEVVTTTTTLD